MPSMNKSSPKLLTAAELRKGTCLSLHGANHDMEANNRVKVEHVIVKLLGGGVRIKYVWSY